jgi:halogenation protein CepH
MYQSEIMGSVMEQGTQIQVEAALGGDLDPAAALFPGGLVPSADSLRWVASAER